MKKLILVHLVLFGALSASAAPVISRYTYSTRIPATAVTCEASAQNLADLVQAALPKAVHVQGECLTRTTFKDNGEQFAMDNVKVSYESDTPLELASAQLPNFDFNAIDLYKKYRDCLNDIDTQATLFTRATGLKPLSATCLPGQDSYYGFTLRIEGAGKPARVLKSFKNLTHVHFAKNAAWKDEVVSYLTQVGGMLAKIHNEMISYYADWNTSLSSGTWFTTNTREQCESQAAEITSMLKKLKAKNVLTRCHSDDFTQYGMDTLYDTYILTYFESTYAQTFFTFEECMAVRQALLDREPAAKYWLGSYCSVSLYSKDRYLLTTVTPL